MSKIKIEAPANASSEVYMKSGSVPFKSPIRNKNIAGVLSIFLGILGVHQFYLKHIGRGIAILVFSLIFSGAFIAVNTMIKMDTTNWLIAFCVYEALFIVRGLLYMFESEKRFKEKNKVRTF